MHIVPTSAESVGVICPQNHHLWNSLFPFPPPEFVFPSLKYLSTSLYSPEKDHRSGAFVGYLAVELEILCWVFQFVNAENILFESRNN